VPHLWCRGISRRRDSGMCSQTQIEPGCSPNRVLMRTTERAAALRHARVPG
jgi:hypothetical protein